MAAFSDALPQMLPSVSSGCTRAELVSGLRQAVQRVRRAGRAAGPDEIPETPQEKRRLKVWFWVMFLGGPVAAGLAALFAGRLPSLMPAALQGLAPTGFEPLIALFAGAGGAGFCVARMWEPRRSLGAQLVLAAAMGVGLMFAYLGLGAVLFAIIYMFVHKISI